MRIARVLLERADRVGLAEGPRLVACDPDGLVALDLRRAAALDVLEHHGEAEQARRIAATCFPGSLTSVLAGGEEVLEWMRRLVARRDPDALVSLEGARFCSPADPPAYRDVMGFGAHIENTWARTGRPPPSVLYELPLYYKGSTATFLGHGATVPWPPYSDWLDFELELAYVIGRRGEDLEPEAAMAHVFGVTILNDFSARDMQFHEMRGRLGPAKGKDFATVLGPVVVTLDELDPGALDMLVMVNGEVVSRASSAQATWGPAESIAWASAAEPVRPGDVVASGCVGRGSGLELGERRLAPGDRVELRVEGIGTLGNVVGERRSGGWRPTKKASG